MIAALVNDNSAYAVNKMTEARALYGMSGAFTISFFIIAVPVNDNSTNAINKMREGMKFDVNNVSIVKAMYGTVDTYKLSFLTVTNNMYGK